jgi:hypothetical protein
VVGYFIIGLYSFYLVLYDKIFSPDPNTWMKCNFMITGTHTILYSTDQEADRNFLQNVLHLTNVDLGHGWLIFGLPPSEIAVHPAEQSGSTELFLLCDNIQQFMQRMAEENIPCDPVQNQRWGYLTYLTLPGGGKLGVYEPLHERPAPM